MAFAQCGSSGLTASLVLTAIACPAEPWAFVVHADLPVHGGDAPGQSARHGVNEATADRHRSPPRSDTRAASWSSYYGISQASRHATAVIGRPVPGAARPRRRSSPPADTRAARPRFSSAARAVPWPSMSAQHPALVDRSWPVDLRQRPCRGRRAVSPTRLLRRHSLGGMTTPPASHCRHCYGDCASGCLLPGTNGLCIHSPVARRSARDWVALLGTRRFWRRFFSGARR